LSPSASGSYKYCAYLSGFSEPGSVGPFRPTYIVSSFAAVFGQSYTPTRSVPMRVAAHPGRVLGLAHLTFFAFLFSFLFFFFFRFLFYFFLSVYSFFCSN
jgi:hypothetical protein